MAKRRRELLAKVLHGLAASLLIAAGFGAGTVNAQDKMSRITDPADGATVGQSFTVKMEVTGLKVEPSGPINPGAGHLHLLVDTDFVAPGVAIPFDVTHLHYGKGQLEAKLNLQPGPHVIRLQFADGAHVALQGNEFLDQINVSVVATPGADGAPTKADGGQQYAILCAGCHGDTGLGLGAFPPINRDLGGREQLINKIATSMPPGGDCRDSCAEDVADFVLSNITGKGPIKEIAKPIDCTTTAEAPTPRVLRLLTQREYENTVQDLLGVSTGLSQNIPVPTRVLGYDNNTDVNVVTTRHIEAYLAAGSDLAERALRDQRGRILPCNGDNNNRQSCADQFVRQLGPKAYRRPLTDDEVRSLSGIVQNASDFDTGVKQALTAMLISPNFLYRSEVGEPMGNGQFKLNSFERANALSYLFWGTMPDQQLFDAAQNNRLERPEDLVQQAKRLLEDQRSRKQIGVFAGQWLSADPMTAGQKDPKVYPNYTRAVQDASDQELVAFVNNVIFDSTGKFPELFKADYVFANRTLGDYYKLSGANSDQVQKISVSDGSRGGVLGLTSVLANRAHADESSPVRRGVFVRRRLLCHDLPPPPPAVNNAPPPLDPKLTTRARFASHSSERFCQSCHQFIDQVGFGLERYDGAGGFRAQENGAPVDDSGSIIAPSGFNPQNLVTGQMGIPFKGLRELSDIIADSADSPRCLTTQFVRHARGLQEQGAQICTINAMFDKFKASGFDIKTLLISIVESPTFTVRQETK